MTQYKAMTEPELLVFVLPIITENVAPPIPQKGDFNWCAYRDGHEENGPYGWGHTQEAAIENLLEQEAA